MAFFFLCCLVVTAAVVFHEAYCDWKSAKTDALNEAVKLGACSPDEALTLDQEEAEDLKKQIGYCNEAIRRKIDGNTRYVDMSWKMDTNYYLLVQLQRTYQALGWNARLTKEKDLYYDNVWTYQLRIKLPWLAEVPSLPDRERGRKPHQLAPAVHVRAEPEPNPELEPEPCVHDLSKVGIDSLEQKFEELEKATSEKTKELEPQPRVLPPLIPGGPERYLDEPENVPPGMVVRYVPNVDILECGWYQLIPAAAPPKESPKKTARRRQTKKKA